MTKSVGIHEAKTHLSELVEDVLYGEVVVITRRGIPIVRLVAVDEHPKRTFGVDVGKFEIPEDFDAPLSNEVLELFYK